MKIAKWGNSLAVRIPTEFADEHGLAAGDSIDLSMEASERLDILRQRTLDQMFEDVRKLRAVMPPDVKFTREEANER